MKQGYHTLSISHAVLLAIGLSMLSVDISAQGIYNNGAKIVLTSGSNIYVDGTTGHYTNASSGTITNNTTGGTLTLLGNWLNNGGNIGFGNDGTTVAFKGASQSIAGSSSTTFYKLSASGSGTKTFNTACNVSNLVSVDGVVLNANGNLTLLATASSNANLGPLLNGASVTNNVIVQSYLTGGSSTYRGYRGISSPINDAAITGDKTFKQLQSKLIITGSGNTANGFDKGSSASPNATTLITYNEPAAKSASQFTAIPSITTATTPGKGYFLYYRGNRTSGYDASGTYATGQKVIAVAGVYATPEDVLVSYTGPVNQNNVVVNLSYTDNGDSDVKTGTNLVGNPYPSVIDWESVTKTASVSAVMYQLKQDHSFATYSSTLHSGTNGGTRYIMPGSAFYVKANGTSQSITFIENCKATSASTPMRFLSAPQSDQVLTSETISLDHHALNISPVRKLSISLENSKTKEETLLAFMDGTSSDYDKEDGFYFAGNSLMLYTSSSDNKDLSINVQPLVTSDSEIEVGVNSDETGPVKLNFTNIPDLGNIHTFLQDKYLNKVVEVHDKDTYDFSIDKSISSSYGANRFSLLFKVPVTLASFTAKKIYSGSQLTWALNNDLPLTYEIERSVDGKEFTAIGVVNNTKEKTNYTFTDSKPETGLNYYRLKLLNPAGGFSYTNVTSLDYSVSVDEQEFKIYPNPVTDVLTILFKQNVKKAYLDIYDLSGRKLKSFTINDSNNTKQNLTDLKTGMYLLKITDEHNKELGSEKFIKN